jgi:hypothetical protein
LRVHSYGAKRLLYGLSLEFELSIYPLDGFKRHDLYFGGKVQFVKNCLVAFWRILLWAGIEEEHLADKKEELSRKADGCDHCERVSNFLKHLGH